MTLGYYSPLKRTGTAVRKHETLGTLSHINKLAVTRAILKAKYTPTMVKKNIAVKQRQKDGRLSSQLLEWLLI